MKRLLFASCAVVLVVAFAGYHRTSVLRLQDATDLRVSGTVGQSQIVIVGGMTHSGMTVTRATAQVCGQRLIARVYIGAIRGDSGVGNYRLMTTMPESVNEIWFGDTPHWMTIGTVFGYSLRVPWFDSPSSGGLIWRRTNKRT